MVELGAAEKKFIDLTDAEVLDWVGQKLHHRGREAVLYVQEILTGMPKQELLDFTVSHFRELMEDLGAQMAKLVAVELHSSIHAHARQPAEATERLNGNLLTVLVGF